MEYGELRSVVLYRTADRWRYAIYSTVGVMDGWFTDFGPEASLEFAQAATRDKLREFFPSDERVLAWRETDEPDWWTADPTAATAPEES